MSINTTESTPAIEVPEAFLEAYITAALWSSTYEDADGDTQNMDDGEYDLAEETRTAMRRDCEEWFRHCQQSDLPPVPEYDDPEYSDDEKSGHDLWLTRNGHGAGYWDRDLGELGDKLTEAAEALGGRDLYVGDDGHIYQS